MSAGLQSGLLIPYARYTLQRLGWTTLAGLGLLLAALVVQYVGVSVPSAEIARLRQAQAVDRAKRQSAVVAPDAKSAELLSAADFQNQLPDATAAAQSLAFIHQAAVRHGVALPSAQYQVLRQGAGEFKKYVMVMPVRASYPALRAWLAEVLNNQQAVALDDLSLQRSSTDGDELEARVRLTLFVAAR